MNKLKVVYLSFRDTTSLNVPAEIVKAISLTVDGQTFANNKLCDVLDAISKDRNVTASSFHFEVSEDDAKALSQPSLGLDSEEVTLYDRLLLRNDLTAVHLVYDSGTVIFNVAWDDISREVNGYQTVKILDNCLSVTVDSNTSH